MGLDEDSEGRTLAAVKEGGATGDGLELKAACAISRVRLPAARAGTSAPRQPSFME